MTTAQGTLVGVQPKHNRKPHPDGRYVSLRHLPASTRSEIFMQNTQYNRIASAWELCQTNPGRSHSFLGIPRRAGSRRHNRNSRHYRYPFPESVLHRGKSRLFPQDVGLGLTDADMVPVR